MWDRKGGMKHVYFLFFFTLLLIASIVGYLTYTPTPDKIQPLHIRADVAKEQLASHMITLQDEDGDPYGLCSGTAIGPHAIITAFHCVHRGKAKSVTIDMATEDHDIVAGAIDGRDHIILLLSGRPFEHWINIVAAQTAVGDTVTLFGSGGGIYPPTPKYGKTVDCQDPSDMDAAVEQSCNTIQTIKGDSGSLIYNTRGEVVSMVTYGREDGKRIQAVGYGLGFTQKQYDVALAFDGRKPPSE